MPIEVSELLNLIGADPKLENVDDVKKHFSSTFIAKTLAVEDDEIINKVTGKRLGALETVVKQQFGLTPAQVKDKKIEEIIEMGATNFKSQMEELKKGNGEPDKKVKEWENKYNTLATEKNDLQTMFDGKVKEWGTKENELTGAIKSSKINYILKDAVSKVKLKDGLSQAEQIGFNSVISTDYKIELADNDEIQIFGKDGKRVAKENQTGFITLDELIPSVAKQLGVLKVNNTNGNQRVNQNTNQNNGGNNGQPVRQAAKLRYAQQ